MLIFGAENHLKLIVCILEKLKMEQESKENKASLSERIYDRLRMVFSTRGLVLLMVTIALFLDNMLLTTVGKYKQRTKVLYLIDHSLSVHLLHPLQQRFL